MAKYRKCSSGRRQRRDHSKYNRFNIRRGSIKSLYDEWRKRVISRDGGKCQWIGCKYTHKRIQVHHIKLYSKYPQLRYATSNGICLCPRHHRGIKGKEQQYEYVFTVIVIKKNKGIALTTPQ